MASTSENDGSAGKPHELSNHQLKALRGQMEFYFSDSNLSRDGFMKQCYDADSNDHWVELDVFLKFNKVRTVTERTNDIVKALRKSTKLELDSSESKVRRTVPFVMPSQKEVDARTIYVDNVPRKCTHDWLRAEFAPFGRVTYVSLPKFKTSGDLKGFAFVEFQTAEAAESCLRAYGVVERNAVAQFPKKGSKDFCRVKKQLEQATRTRKRHHSESGSVTTADALAGDSADALEQPAGKRLRRQSYSSSNDGEHLAVREKLAKDRSRTEEEFPANGKALVRSPNLTILSKEAWTLRKRDYVSRQKAAMKEMKQQLRKINELPSSSAAQPSQSAQERSHGCLVELTNLPSEKFNTKEEVLRVFSIFKDEIAFVDMCEGDDNPPQRTVVIRCKTVDVASDLASHVNDVMKKPSARILPAEIEVDYWEKVRADNLNKSKKKNRKGKSKLLSRCIKQHLIFDEDDG